AAALHAPWPTVPALSLALGLGAALAWALSGRFPALAGIAVVAAGAGLAGALATKPATLTALSATLVVAVVCGVAGRGPARRPSARCGASRSACGHCGPLSRPRSAGPG